MEEPQDVDAHLWKKYASYSLFVDPKQDDRAIGFRPSSARDIFGRPHLRALFCSLLAYFMSFFVWFAINPLLKEYKSAFNIPSRIMYETSVVAFFGTMTSRVIVGPFCDRFGARICIVVVFIFSSIMTCMAGLLHNDQDLKAVRFFIGFGGCIFVVCQYWTSCMFAKNIVGTANAFVAGWGRVGGYLSEKLMGNFLFPKLLEMNKKNLGQAWQIAPIIPAAFVIVSGPIIYSISDDSPRGNFIELKKHNAWGMPSLLEYIRMAAVKHNTWLLLLQFGCSNGAEISMNRGGSYMLEDRYDEEASKFPDSLWYMWLFAGIVGGMISDAANRKFGMKGRLVVQMFFLLIEGSLIMAFPRTISLGAAKFVFVAFQATSLASQASTLAIAPYVCVPATGWVMGLVGAGGSIGAYAFGTGFEFLRFETVFDVMGLTLILSSLLSAVNCFQEEAASNQGIEYSNEPEGVPQDIYA